MLVDGHSHRTLWPSDSNDALFVIDQRHLPHRFVVERLAHLDAVFHAIRDTGYKEPGDLAGAGPSSARF